MIANKPKKPANKQISDTDLASFIDRAPDSKAAAPTEDTRQHIHKGGGDRVQISFTLPLNVLLEVESKAKEMGVSRVAFLNMCIHEKLRG